MLRTAALAGACVLVIVAAVYVLVRFLMRLAPLTLAVIVALLLAALVSPVSDALRRRRLPAWFAALTGVLVLLAAVVPPLVLIGNRTAGQLPHLQERLSDGLARIRELVLHGPLPISERQMNAVVDGLVKAVREAAPDPLGGAGAAVQGLASALLALVLLFFILKDGEGMWRWMLHAFPRRFRRPLQNAAQAGWGTLVSYVRGTVLIALVDAVGIGLALLLIGVPLALPLALLTFLAAFVPIIGATVAGAVAVLVAFVSNGLLDALLVLIAVIVVQQAEGNILQPLIMGRALRLHPVVILLTVTAGTLLAGIAGAVVATPITAVGVHVVASLRDTIGGASRTTDRGPAEASDRDTPHPGR